MSWSERAGKIFCFLSVGVGIYLLFKYALGIFLPFIIAWGLALMIRPLAKRLSKNLRVSKKVCAVSLTVVFLILVGGILYLAVNRLIYESERLFEKLAENSDKIGASVGAFLDKISSLPDKNSPILESLLKIEQFREFWENIDNVISNTIASVTASLTSTIPGALLSFLSRLPSLLIFLLITIVSCFYFAADIDKINQKTLSLCPEGVRRQAPHIKKRLVEKLSMYLRAYVILLFLTFGELLVGFLMLRVPYPLLLAVIISILDILPLLGVGTVLIPWALVEIIFSKDYYTGIGLFILYVIITVVRQITEPKIVAGSLGLSPLLTLIAMYAGLRLFGFFGIIIGPFALLIIKTVKEFSASNESSVDKKKTI